jgi:hypothetical protein
VSLPARLPGWSCAGGHDSNLEDLSVRLVQVHPPCHRLYRARRPRGRERSLRKTTDPASGAHPAPRRSREVCSTVLCYFRSSQVQHEFVLEGPIGGYRYKQLNMSTEKMFTG